MKTLPVHISATRIRVLCVDDSRDITASLGRCIDGEPDMESVGCLDTADDLSEEVEKRRPDVVLLDMKMPGRDPIAALRALTANAALHGGPAGGAGRGRGGSRATRVIVFSGRDDQDAEDKSAAAGACGFLSKGAQVPVILGAIREVARGHASFGVWR